MRPEIELWETYGPLFHMEESRVFPPDEAELDFYRHIRSRFAGSCLELGAGSGRLTGSLAASGITVGLDASQAMLALWSESDSELAVKVRGFAHCLPFSSCSLDLVLLTYNLLHCILHPEERHRLLTEAVRVLVPGGKLVIEACPAFSLRPVEPPTRRYGYQEGRDTLELVESVSRDREAGTITFHMNYSGSAVPVPTGTLDLTLATLGAGEILRMIRGSGMSVLSVWGDYDLSPWSSDSSPRLLALAERK